MMKLDKIRISNFKVFQDALEIDVNQKNLLILGENGAGKSSIYWSLYTFLQSSSKVDDEIKKYFKVYDENDPSTYQTLRNIYAKSTIDSFIQLKFIDDSGEPSEFIISESQIDTNSNSSPINVIKDADLASDFINYKLLHNFYNSTHKNEINLWQVLIRDFFPYFKVDDKTYYQMLKEMIQNYPVKRASGGLSMSFKVYKADIKKFNDEIELFIGKISQEANKFLSTVLWEHDNCPQIIIEYSKKLTAKAIKQYSINLLDEKYDEVKVKLSLAIKVDSDFTTNTQRPHSFYNEAMLTRIALAIRFAALFLRLSNSKIKILVLDDILISLDMSNRMRLIKTILNTEKKRYLIPFDEYQKIILTQDKSFFNIIKQLTNDSDDWLYYQIMRSEKGNNPPHIEPWSSNIDKATFFLQEKQYEACGVFLRKEFESILQKYLDPDFKSLATGEYEGLTKMISSAISKVEEKRRHRFDKIFRSDEEIDFIRKIETDFINDTSLTEAQIGRLTSLKKRLHNYLYDSINLKREGETLLRQIKEILDRILNASSHATSVPLFEEELEDAIEKMKKLKIFLHSLTK